MHWRKSSYTGGANDEHCVELGRLGSGVGVRDSKDVAGGHLRVSLGEFAGLLDVLKRAASG
ncbi:DUF397 domain-containing protein [Actinomadura rupiterrae]|uniref:DUF397 domain-containing protein n=1 Tax=Actinomadura rupiterrae TaxID=559627 RepID=UPI0020A5ED43|nr:DUF397 domain-containing protein [Actinomadura rupiterrae]